MQRPARQIAGMLGVWLSLLAAIPAQAGPTGCIRTFRPIRWSYSCPTPTGCGSPCSCGCGEYCYDYPYQVLDCATGEPTNSCSSTAENEAYAAWLDANLPVGADRCENPWSGVFIGCNQAPEPNTCGNPINDKRSMIGDPVDLTTGAQTDVGQDAVFRGYCACHQIASLRADGLVSRCGEIDAQCHEPRLGSCLDHIGRAHLPVRLARVGDHSDNGRAAGYR